MNLRYLMPLLCTAICLCGCESAPTPDRLAEPCSEPWFEMLEEYYPTGDGAGHGPDIGSEEWKSVIEFKLGIREDPKVPNPDSV